MPTLEEEEAFSQLRARQGAGARYDAESAPAHDLLLARRGTAYFARLLNNLRDTELYEPSSIRNWTRAHVVAAVAYNAIHITRIVEAARLGLDYVETPTDDDQAEAIDYAATLPAHALRNLFKHSEVHLNVEWRDLTSPQWNINVAVKGINIVGVKDTPRIRANFIWDDGIALNVGGSRLRTR
jgi:maleylpyruvate isomerase